MTQTLEDRYRRLLRSYPKTYRQERSAEILGTLMDLAQPGQQRPTIREAVSLVLSGLRVRTGAHQRRTTGAVWVGAFRVAVLLLLADAAAVMFSLSVSIEKPIVVANHYAAHIRQLSAPSDPAYVLTTVLIAVALLALAAGRARIGLLLTLVATVAQHWAPQQDHFEPVLWQLPVAAVLTVPLLLWRTPGSRRAAWWLLAIPTALIVMPTELPVVHPAWLMQILFQHGGILLTLVLLWGCTLWSVVDARIPIAAGVTVLSLQVPEVLNWVTDHFIEGLTGGSQAMDLLQVGIAGGIPLAAGAIRAARLHGPSTKP